MRREADTAWGARKTIIAIITIGLTILAIVTAPLGTFIYLKADRFEEKIDEANEHVQRLLLLEKHPNARPDAFTNSMWKEQKLVIWEHIDNEVAQVRTECLTRLTTCESMVNNLLNRSLDSMND